MTLIRISYRLLAFVVLFCAGGHASLAETPIVRTVSGCKLLKHPSRFNGKMLIVKGKYTIGFERSDLTFGCRGSVGVRVSLSPADLKANGFVTEQSTVDEMSKLPPGESPGDNLNARKLRYAPVTVIGRFKCHYDFSPCKNASPYDGSIVLKSMRFNAPISEVPSDEKPSAQTNMTGHESDQAVPGHL
jgi:hypothetical protein